MRGHREGIRGAKIVSVRKKSKMSLSKKRGMRPQSAQHQSSKEGEAGEACVTGLEFSGKNDLRGTGARGGGKRGPKGMRL